MSEPKQTIPKSRQSRFLQTCLSSSWGGLEMVAYELALSFKKRNLFMVVVAEKNSPLEKACLQQKIPVEIMPQSKNYFTRLFFIRKLFLKHKIDTVIEQKLPTLKYTVPASLFLPKKIKFFGFSHIMINFSKKDFFHRFLYSKVNKVFALTDNQAKRLLELLPISKNQLAVVPNWISADKVTPSSSAANLPEIIERSENHFTALISSRLDPQKGQDIAIKALKILKNQNIIIDLIIAGENTKNERDYKSELETLTNQLELNSQVKFVGYQKNLTQWYSQVDVLLVPSYEETFGRVIIEAMATGLPSIASNAGGVPDIIQHKQNGLLFETKNENDLANKLIEFINDPTLQNELSKNCLIDAKKYDQETIVNKIIEIVG